MGLNMNELYPSKWIKADDFEEGEKRVVTIKAVELEELEQKGGKKEDKPVCYFEECKPLVLNKTNASIIAHLYGNDTDDWIGKRITLFTMEVDSFGEIVSAVRVKNQVPRELPKTAPQGAPQQPTAPQQNGLSGITTPAQMAQVWSELQSEGRAVGVHIKGLPPGEIPLDKFQDWQIKAREQINAARVAMPPAPDPMASPVAAPDPMASPVAAPVAVGSPFDDYDDSDPFADS